MVGQGTGSGGRYDSGMMDPARQSRDSRARSQLALATCQQLLTLVLNSPIPAEHWGAFDGFILSQQLMPANVCGELN